MAVLYSNGRGASIEVMQLMAAGCLAGMLVLFATPAAHASERNAGDRTSLAPVVQTPRSGVPASLLDVPPVTTATQRLDLASLAPDAFADWDDAQR